MKHGKYYLLVVLRCLAVCSFISLFSCHSNRQATETKEIRESSYYCDSVFVDSKLVADTARTERRDTTAATATETGTILVHRDSTGKPERITWTITQNIKGITQRTEEKERLFYGLNATRHSESSGAVDSVATKKEKVTQTVDTRISLVNIIGPVLLVLVIYIFWQWIKQKRSR